MSSIATFSDYKSKITNSVNYPFVKSLGLGGSAGEGGFMSSWLSSPGAGVAPSTAAVPGRSTVGGLLTQPALKSLTAKYILAQARAGVSQITPGTSHLFDGFSMMLCDRISHQGGLDGNSSSTQTTNLPTAALTRYTDGVGVMAALEVYTQLGGTPTTATCSYTNQANTSGQASQAIAVGGGGTTPVFDTGGFYPMTLKDGDTGVRAVASVTLAAGTGVTGNFGVTLYKPLMMLPAIGQIIDNVEQNWVDNLIAGALSMIEVDDNACLFFLTWPYMGHSDLAANGRVAAELNIIEV